MLQNKPKPKCVQCEVVESLLWRKTPDNNGHICYNCFEENQNQNRMKNNEKQEETAAAAAADEQLKITSEDLSGKQHPNQRVRKSTRSTRYKAKGGGGAGGAAANGAGGSTGTAGANGGTGNGGAAAGNGNNGTTGGGGSKTAPKGRSRRNMFKKIPTKTPSVTATTKCVESLFHNGSYIQVGDIVSLVDLSDDVYYAQVRGLLIDSYCEKSAFLTWLLPTTSSPSPKERFDASSYIIGPDEDFPRKLSCLEFVMHAPSNYYHNKTMPYPPPDLDDYSTTTPGGFIWTNIADGPLQ